MRFLIGNWKMQCTRESALALTQKLNDTADKVQAAKVVVCPSLVHLEAVKSLLNPTIGLGAQNCHQAEKGAFTGEVSVPMLKELGCEYVIVGHSERRHGMGENSTKVAEKAAVCKQYGLTPIVCVGELLAERESGMAEKTVEHQLLALPSSLTEFIVAYEPVWAIGTGKVATPEAVASMHEFIFGVLTSHFGQVKAANTAILYGGSVKADNAATLMHLPYVSGALVGGASLDANEFISIGQAMA